MAQRGFGWITLTANPQPVFGTLTTAPIRPTPDRATGRLDVASAPSYSVIPVANAALFRQGDHCLIGLATDFAINPTSAVNPPDGGVISAVDTVNNKITVSGLTRKHNASEWAILALPCAQVNIQNGASEIYLGEDATVAANSAYLWGDVLASGNYSLGNPAFANNVETQKVWVSGTAAAKFLPNLLTV